MDTNWRDASITEVFLVRVPDWQALFEVSCSWKISGSMATNLHQPHHFGSLDLLLGVNPKPYAEKTSTSLEPGTALENLVRSCYTDRAAADQVEVPVKVIFAPRYGFLCRADILELRMKHSRPVDIVVRFPASKEQCSPIPTCGKTTLISLLELSPGALITNQHSNSLAESFELLGDALTERLSFDWVLPTKPAARKVAVIGGRPMFDEAKLSYGSQGPFEAARALGLSLVVIDRPGHWLEGETYAHLRDDFIAVDMTSDKDLPLNIVQAVKDKSLDGIITFSDEFVIATATAAEMLNLPTESVQSILSAHYKDATRKVVKNHNVQVLRLDRAEQLDDPSMAEALRSLEYPLIAKPCRGGASRGVKRVTNDSSLREAVQKMEEEGFARHGILLETYIDGPEVDANLVLWNGEIMFCEISDDFPCQADAADATISDNFAETIIVLPSRLDTEELQLIRSSLHRNLLDMGFSSGVFHLEARVRNSSMRYQDADGVFDLVKNVRTTAEKVVDVFLIEVNARPPGLQSVFATTYTYGVEYCGLQFLRALGDQERFTALSKPFVFGSQYCCGIVLIPIHRSEIAIPDNFCEKVLQRLPEIEPHVSRAERIALGKVISPSGGAGFIGYFLLFSRTSRRHVIEMSNRVRDVSKDVLDGV